MSFFWLLHWMGVLEVVPCSSLLSFLFEIVFVVGSLDFASQKVLERSLLGFYERLSMPPIVKLRMEAGRLIYYSVEGDASSGLM